MENHVIKKKALTFLPLAICLLFKTTSITILINLPPLQIWNQIMHSREWLKLKRTSSLEREAIWSNLLKQDFAEPFAPDYV